MAGPRLCSPFEPLKENVAVGDAQNLHRVELVTLLEFEESGRIKLDLEIALHDTGTTGSQLRFQELKEQLNADMSQFLRPIPIFPAQGIEQQLLVHIFAHQRQRKPFGPA